MSTPALWMDGMEPLHVLSSQERGQRHKDRTGSRCGFDGKIAFGFHENQRCEMLRAWKSRASNRRSKAGESRFRLNPHS